ncbi:unnamed protein product, partial [Symbiodinium pilosum]
CGIGPRTRLGDRWAARVSAMRHPPAADPHAVARLLNAVADVKAHEGRRPVAATDTDHVNVLTAFLDSALPLPAAVALSAAMTATSRRQRNRRCWKHSRVAAAPRLRSAGMSARSPKEAVVSTEPPQAGFCGGRRPRLRELWCWSAIGLDRLPDNLDPGPLKDEPPSCQ